MSSEAPTGNGALFRKVRKVSVALLFALANTLAWHRTSTGPDLRVAPVASRAHRYNYSATDGLTSGVGLVTTDGLWEDDPGGPYAEADIKILGFTDKNYSDIARLWYMRLTLLGYTEHYIVAYDEVAFISLQADNYRVIPCFLKNPDYAHPTRGLWQQIMSARLHLTRDMLRAGTHLLITDIDNVFSRHVPLRGFLEEGYDAFHAFEMRYPEEIYDEAGLVVCSGHQFLRSSPGGLRFMDRVLASCSGAKCDDQVIYNHVIFRQLDVRWDGMDRPDRPGALRVNSTIEENDTLLVESVTGRSPVTNHTIKIWDRDFAWRLAAGIPEHCPSMNNWVGMPTKLGLPGYKTGEKLAGFGVWDKHCRSGR